MNTTPCGKCSNYDPVLGPAGKNTHRGWCTPRSVYPTQEQDGHVFPANAVRAPVGELAKPYIVKDTSTILTCELVRPTTTDLHASKKAKIIVPQEPKDVGRKKRHG